MYLEGDALDLFSWLNSQRTMLYWPELVKAFEEHYELPEFLNLDEHLCNIQQSGTVAEYRQEWAKRVACIINWPEHCLLGGFLNGLREEHKSEVRVHKPRAIYRASLALEFEKKSAQIKGSRPNSYYTSSRPTLTANPMCDK